MKIKIETKPLIEALARVLPFIHRRTSFPVLDCVLVKGNGEKLTLTTTDLEAQASTWVESTAQGAFCVSGRRLVEILKHAGESVIINAEQRVSITSGKQRHQLSCFPEADFPVMPLDEGGVVAVVSGVDLRQMIDRTFYAAGTHDIRYYLNGLYFERKNGLLRVAATDGSRLAAASTKSAGEDFEAIAPRGTIASTEGAEIAEIVVMSRFMLFNGPNITVISKKVDGKFPDIDRVIPAPQPPFAVIDRKVLEYALRVVQSSTNEKFRGVRLETKGAMLRVKAEDANGNESEIEIERGSNGTNISCGFKINYLLDAIEHGTADTVSLEQMDSLSALHVQEKGDISWHSVVMPFRI